MICSCCGKEIEAIQLSEKMSMQIHNSYVVKLGPQEDQFVLNIDLCEQCNEKYIEWSKRHGGAE